MSALSNFPKETKSVKWFLGGKDYSMNKGGVLVPVGEHGRLDCGMTSNPSESPSGLEELLTDDDWSIVDYKSELREECHGILANRCYGIEVVFERK